jgi:hypothetical protein
MLLQMLVFLLEFLVHMEPSHAEDEEHGDQDHKLILESSEYIER